MHGPAEQIDIVRTAIGQGKALDIKGGGSRTFPRHPSNQVCVPLSMAGHSGIIEYYPEELVIRARAGTPMTELKACLDAEGQMFAFDPPVASAFSTLGGLFATGLSGSRRPYAGALKDAVLGVGVILSDGAYAEFGGQVMKNVAGYDVSRLMCGAFGVLGPVADVSLKVLPKPECEQSIALALPIDHARSVTTELVQRVSGLSGSCYWDGVLNLRFSGSEAAVARETRKLGGDSLDAEFWDLIDTQTLPVFEKALDVWRLSVSRDEPVGDFDFAIQDWGFTQRWLLDPASDPRASYQGAGHWTRYRSDSTTIEADTFQPVTAVELRLHTRLKDAFDPDRRFNPDRLFRGL